MADEPLNAKVRQKVADYFCQIVPKGKLLDFGAGTGLDTAWQVSAGYEVIFYEPSAGMAQVAIDQFSVEGVDFEALVGEEANLESLKKLPSEAVDAVFSNFAALNSVSAPAEFMAEFARLIKPGGHLICVINHNFGPSVRLKSLLTYPLGLSKKSVHRQVSMPGGLSMPVYYHPPGMMNGLAKRNGLSLVKREDLNFDGHVLSHFVKRKS